MTRSGMSGTSLRSVSCSASATIRSRGTNLQGANGSFQCADKPIAREGRKPAFFYKVCKFNQADRGHVDWLASSTRQVQRLHGRSG
jgi:hypothetical protein